MDFFKRILTLCIAVILILSFSCAAEERYREEMLDYINQDDPEEMLVPVEVAYLYRAKEFFFDCVLTTDKENRKALYSFDKEALTEKYDGIVGYFCVNGKNYFALANRGKNGLPEGNIFDEKGNRILPGEDKYNFILSEDDTVNNPNNKYIKYPGDKYYYYFDCENLEKTDFVYHKERMKWENNNGIENLYDVIEGEYLFEPRYSEVKYEYLYKKYWFSVKDDEGYHLLYADDSTGKLEIKEYCDRVFDNVEFESKVICLMYNKETRKYFIRCEAPGADVYIDEKGNRQNEDWYNKITGNCGADIMQIFPQKLPEGMEIKYRDEYYELEGYPENYIAKEKAVYSQGREIIPYTTNPVLFLDGNYIRVGSDIYDIEGNLIYEATPGTSFYHYPYCINDNKAYCIRAFAHSQAGCHCITFLNPAPKIYINGEFMLTDTLPRIKNGRTLVPLRAFAEMMEFQVKEPDEKGRIEISKEGKTVAFTLGSLEGEKDGEKFKLEAAPEIINNRTLVPLRALAEAFECEVEWNGETTEVVISN